jgi:hypothetical protein
VATAGALWWVMLTSTRAAAVVAEERTRGAPLAGGDLDAPAGKQMPVPSKRDHRLLGGSAGEAFGVAGAVGDLGRV